MPVVSRSVGLGALVAALATLLAAPAAAQGKPALTPKDYGRFESVGRATLSPDGRWIAYQITSVDERAELRIARTDRDSTRAAAWGTRPAFSADGRWLAWSIGVSPEERKRLEKEKQPVRSGLGLLDLASGVERVVPEVASFEFDLGGRFLAALGYPPDEPKGKGADLRVMDLETSAELTIGNVTELAWSDAAPLLALTIATGADRGNGVQVYDAVTGRLRGLDASSAAYRQLAWRKDANDLAVLRSVEPASKNGARHTLLAWRELRGRQPALLQLEPRRAGLIDTLEVVQHRRPAWSEDGTRISLGLRPVPDSLRNGRPADSAKAAPSDSGGSPTKLADDDLAQMQIWSTRDVRIIPQQKASAERDARRTLLAVWEPESNRLVQVGTGLLESAEVAADFGHGVERVSEPYPWGEMFGRPYHDVFVVDLADAARTKALDSVRYSWLGPSGQYLLWFDGRDYWSKSLASSEELNLTRDLGAVFADTAYDTPTDLLPPHGVGGWVQEDGAVFLYDRYDVWRVAPDGSGAVRLTDGAREQVVHRVVDLDPEEEAFDARAPLYLSLHGEWSEKRGFARVLPGGEVERLVYDDRYFASLQKADSAEVLVYRAEARDDSPDFFAAGMTLRDPRQVSATNPFVREYAWGKTELIEFQSQAGRRLQGVLLYPANHDPSRRYPMIVYTYEMLSPQAHLFEVPSERDYYSFIAWTEAGYFVLMPDIVFTARAPGPSVVQTLEPAVAKVASMGLIDPKRVGLIGHSWGGYNAAFVPTRSNVFAASVAGAPLTDFVSFMGQIHWTPGLPELSHWETGQARMEVPYWEDPDAHHRASPVHKVQDMETPLLLAHGDKDGVVEFFQSTEFYNFARRAGKQVVLLVYEGENHGFVKKGNQIDYHRRILEWFGHYLKGEPAPDWITKGVPWEKQREEIRRVAKSGEPAAAKP